MFFSRVRAYSRPLLPGWAGTGVL